MGSLNLSRFSLYLPLLLLAAGSFFFACSLIEGPLQGSGSGFARKEFLEYRTVAILPFEGDGTGEVSDAFAQSLRKRFPGMEVIERNKVLQNLGDYPRLPFQSDRETRAGLIERLGAQALVEGDVFYPTITRWLLQVKIIDTKTGEVLGHASAEVNFMGTLGFEEGCDLAVRNLQPR